MLVKRVFDIVFALLGLLLLFIPILLFYFIAMIDTGKNGFFIQSRIGRYGRPFKIIKLRSMKDTAQGKKVTCFGRFMRKFKIDEFPQLLNILAGSMSLVGPRPDVPGYYDTLTEPYCEILKLKPGLTGPASLKYSNEEEILAKVQDSQRYNDEVIFPDKLRINLNYLKYRTFWLDIKILCYTFTGIKPKEDYFK
ncbi:sugar transferase [Flavobacterium rhizosphaerae]|uniref:Sugar transferase n=1 Tax=Flavobacterium rhizosphaerae TaxID=3163298 RepID=A0ABW8Z0S1_9FLAO